MSRGRLALLLLLAGCGRGGGNGSVVTRDSAGVHVVEVPGASAELDRRWGRQAVPEFSTAGVNGGEAIELFQVRSVHRYPDGRLLIANGGTGELLLVDPRGGAARRYGRKGQGPGEFTMLAAMWPGGGDSVYVYDLQQARVTPFTPAGGFGSPVALPRANAEGFLGLSGRFADGAYLGSVMKGIRGGTATGVVADSMLVVRVPPGGPIATLARLPFGRSWVHSEAGTTMVVAVPFDAGGVAVAAGQGYYLGDTGWYELRRYDAKGRLEMVIRREVAPVAVTRADVDRELASQDRAGSPSAAMRRLYAEMPIPRHFPTFRRVAAPRDGGIWIQDYPVRGDEAPVTWTAFADDGSITGRVTLPPRTRLAEVTGDRVVAVVTDEDDVESVAVFRLQPAQRR
jgi:hypothetical protein